MEKTISHDRDEALYDPDWILAEAEKAGVDLDALRYNTQDIDFCYARDPENLERLFKALKPFNPVIRPNSHLTFDLTLLQENDNFTLDTEVGEIDLGVF
ncbi:MAG: hypothetical protein ACE5GO_12685, partial [Anaerolineales bacterium]